MDKKWLRNEVTRIFEAIDKEAHNENGSINYNRERPICHRHIVIVNKVIGRYEYETLLPKNLTKIQLEDIYEQLINLTSDYRVAI